MKKLACTITIFFVFFSNLNAAGESGAEFLKFETGARPMGMGGAYAGLADDINALWWNPAGLGNLEFKEFTFMHNEAGEGIGHHFSSFIYPVAPLRGTLGGSVNYFYVDDIQGYDEGGMPTKKLKADNLGINLAYGLNYLSPFYLGVTMGYLKENLASYSDSTLSLNAGLIWDTPAENLRLGLNLMNMGGGFEYIEEVSPLPFKVKTGCSYRAKLYGLPLILTADANFPKYRDSYYNIGSEVQFFDLFAVRGGYNSKESPAGGLRLGGGLKNKNISLDYAWNPRGDLAPSHRFSFSLKWGRKFNEAAIEKNIREKFELGKKYYNGGNLIQAYQIFSTILRAAPRHEGAGEYISRIELSIEDAETSKIIEEALRKGKEYLDGNELIKAGEQFETILKLDPDNQRARDYIKTIDERFESVEEAILDRAMENFQASNFDKAWEEFQRVLTLNPDNHTASRHIEKIEQRRKEQEQIKQRLQQERESRILRRQISSHMNSAAANFRNGNWEQTVSDYHQVLELEPGHSQARKSLADTLYRQGDEFYKENNFISSKEKLIQALEYDPDIREAIELLETVKQEMSEKAADLNRQALSRYSAGNLTQAIHLWEKSLEYNPDLEQAAGNLRRAKRELRD